MVDLEKPQHFTKEQSEWIKEFVKIRCKETRNAVIDELTQKVEFEEKWLFECYRENGCKYSDKDIDIAFDGIKHCLRKLKGE